jgi:hypothetical protein
MFCRAYGFVRERERKGVTVGKWRWRQILGGEAQDLNGGYSYKGAHMERAVAN